ncbi:MAG TPA: TRAP transporter substrate-binding protein [Burkholderiales bacterium]
MRIACLLAALAAVIDSAGPAWSQALPPTQIKVIASSDQSNLHKNLERPFWTERLPKASGGAIKVEFSGLLSSGLKGPEIVRLMRSGAIDFAHGVFQSVGADDPSFEGMDLAGLATDVQMARRVADAYKPVIDRVFREKHGIKLLAMVPFTAQVFFCRVPISGMADLKGKKVRVFGRSLADFVTAVGGSTVTIPFGEVVPSLQTGVADCAITGVASGNTAKWTDVTTHLYVLPVGWSMSFYAVNQKRWDSFDPKVRDFLGKQIGQLENDIWALTAEENQDGVNCNIGQDPCKYGYKAKMTLVQLAPRDLPTLQQIMRDTVVPAWAKRCGTACAREWNDTVGKTVGISAPTQ